MDSGGVRTLALSVPRPRVSTRKRAQLLVITVARLSQCLSVHCRIHSLVVIGRPPRLRGGEAERSVIPTAETTREDAVSC